MIVLLISTHHLLLEQLLLPPQLLFPCLLLLNLLLLLFFVLLFVFLIAIAFFHLSLAAVHLHDLFEDFTGVYTHLFGELEDLGVELLKIDIVEVDGIVIVFFLVLMSVGIHGVGLQVAHIVGGLKVRVLLKKRKLLLLLLFTIESKEVLIHFEVLLFNLIIVLILFGVHSAATTD